MTRPGQGVGRVLAGAWVAWSLLSVAATAHGGGAPEWLARAAASPTPAEDARAQAVTLLDEQIVSFEGHGATHSTRRRAIRVLSAEGRAAAVAAIRYETSSAKVNDLRAWILRPGGGVKELGSSEIIDMALVNGDVYNEARVRSIVGSDEVEVGGIFGWECHAEDHSVLREFEWAFQDEHPTLCSRFTLDTPGDWKLNATTFNHAPIIPVRTGSARTWELRNLREIPTEPMRPPITSLVPRLAVSAIPPSPRADAVAFETWDSLAAWMHDLAILPARPDEAVGAKARALAGDLRTREERVRAVANFVQGIPYASIQMGNGRGGGYQPRPAGEVLARSYGDCKDKANLMCCMLRSLGIEAYLLVVYSDDQNYVREEWPAAQQFNHCIVAMEAADALQGPVVVHPQLGRLLLFDPTDTNTLFGDLPLEEQGSLGVLMVRDPGALIRLPVLPAERNRMERTNDVTLMANGSIQGTMRERSWGSIATQERDLFRSMASTPYRDRVQAWLAASAPRAVVSALRAEPQDSVNAFELNIEYSSERYAQAMSGLLILRPTFVERSEEVPASDAPRTSPIDIEERTCREMTRVHLPPGITPDELPEPVHLETPFGAYTWEVERDGPPGELRVRREIVMHRTTLPPEQYPAVRAFYEKVRAAEQSRVVLARTSGGQ